MYEEKFHDYFLAHKEAMLKDLEGLIAINSEQGPAEEGKPFGPGPYQALHAAKALLEQYGFIVKNYDNYALTADLDEKERQLDMLCHLDVVPAGDGWSVTEPFVMKVQDGKVYGRGTADDKGPAICALYAMKAFKDLQIPLKKGVRLILGTNEETGSKDIEYYFSKEKSAPMTISPDADFPLIFLEKGRLGGNFFAKNLKSGEGNPDVTILSLHAGQASNAVPGRARTLIKGIPADEWKIFTEHAGVDMGLAFEIEERDDAVSITVVGEGAHASSPEHGRNALTGLLTLLMSVESIRKNYPALEGLCKCFPHGDFRGHAMGVDLEDPVSGKTSLALTVLHLADDKAEGWFDLRGGIPATKDNTTDVIRRYLEEAGWTLDENAALSEVHYVPRDSELVIKLMASYKKITGRDEEPLAIGGGTYVHEIENGVAFGCADPNVDNRMHGPDEFMSIDQMLLSCEIFADAILSICG